MHSVLASLKFCSFVDRLYIPYVIEASKDLLAVSSDHTVFHVTASLRCVDRVIMYGDSFVMCPDNSAESSAVTIYNKMTDRYNKRATFRCRCLAGFVPFLDGNSELN